MLSNTIQINLSSGISAGLTTPVDVVKTRIMLADQKGDHKHRPHQILRNIYRQNGVRGIFAGFTPRVTWITIGGAIFFGSYDLATKFISKQLGNV